MPYFDDSQYPFKMRGENKADREGLKME